MKESQFIRDNEADWKRLESLLQSPLKDADQILRLFEKVSGDLAYARTFYPNRSVRLYLNNLTQKVLNSIDTRKSKFSVASIVHFYRHELPAIVYENRKAFYTSFLVFVVSMMIGAISSAHVPEFAEIILGEDYIEITEDNINDGDPMAIYKSEEEGRMFMMITINNIKVSFFCFMLGFFAGIGTIYILIVNGIMVGVFQYFFYQKGLFLTSFLTIWIHGTIEILAIIIAGAAGLILGNGLLFPKSYDRNSSLLISAKKALKVILGIIPLFIIAGFLESFVTRLTDLPMIMKILIIGLSLLFILTIFVIYPYRYAKNFAFEEGESQPEPTRLKVTQYDKYELRTLNHTLGVAMATTRQIFSPFFKHFILPFTIVIAATLYLLLKFKLLASIDITQSMDLQKFSKYTWPLALITCIGLTLALITLMILSQKIKLDTSNKLKQIKKNFLILFPFVTIYYIGFSYCDYWTGYIFLAVLPPQILFILSEKTNHPEFSYFSSIVETIKESYQKWMNFLIPNIFMWNLAVLSLLLLELPVISIFTQMITWHNLFDNFVADKLFIYSLTSWLITCFLMPLAYCLYTYWHGSLESAAKSEDLYKKLDAFGQGSNLFEIK